MQTITINRNNNKKMKNRGVIKGPKGGLFFPKLYGIKKLLHRKIVKIRDRITYELQLRF